MAKKAGNDYRVYIESATPGTYNEIKGQQDANRSGGNSYYDTSSKDTGAYATKAAAQKEVNWTLSVRPDLPDANGYTRLETLANATPAAPFKIQVRKSPYAAGDVIFEGSVYGDITSVTYPQNNVVQAQISFALAAAPTVDALS